MKRLEWRTGEVGKWILTFNAGKCKIVHIGHNNPQEGYQLNGAILQKTTKEQDFGIIVSSNLKPLAHVDKVAAKASSRLGVIMINFSILDKEILLPLFVNGTPHPWLCWPVLVPAPYWHTGLGTHSAKKEQKLGTSSTYGTFAIHREMLTADLQTLQDHRIRWDMIEIYKLLHVFENIPYTRFLKGNTIHVGTQ